MMLLKNMHNYLTTIISINLFFWHIVCFFATYLHLVFPIPFLKNNSIISYSYERRLENVIQLPKTFKNEKAFCNRIIGSCLRCYVHILYCFEGRL